MNGEESLRKSLRELDIEGFAGWVKAKPKKGFEPLTPALRKRCSTVELLRRLAASLWGSAAEGGKISINRVNSTMGGHCWFGGEVVAEIKSR